MLATQLRLAPETARPAIFFALIASAILLTAWLSYAQMRMNAEQAVFANLTSIGKLKVEEIERWVKSKSNELALISTDSQPARILSHWMQTGDETSMEIVRARLAYYLKNFEASAVVAFDLHGVARISAGSSIEIEGAHQPEALKAISSKNQVLIGFHRHAGSEQIAFGLMQPVLVDGHIGGVMLLEYDPNTFIYPLIQEWPVPSLSAETLLVQAQGERVIYLNELRHRHGTALAMTMPVPNLTLPAARAVNGEVGIVRGTDYRGVDVFAYIGPVSGTPWKIVSKIDAKEALATINQIFVATLLAMGILLPLSGGMVWLWWRRNNELVESEILQGRLEQQALKQRYQSLTQMANDIILLADTNGRFIEVNDRAVEVYGYSREELVKMSGADLRSPDTRPEMPRLLEDLRQRKNMTYETVHMAKDGRCFPVEVSARFIESGNEHYYHLLIRDCTERKRAESQLRMAATVFETTSESIILTDPIGTILDVNDAFVVVNGYSREEVIGKNPSLLKSGHQDSEFYAAMWQTIKSEGRWHGELWNRKKNGDVYVGIMSITAVYDDRGTVLHYVGVTTDITALKQHQQEVEHLAYHDTLTQLPNRVLLSDRMQQALARAKRFEESVAVVCLDLDGFKAVNDTLGHAAGDNLLIEVASRLIRCVRTDDTVARLGGDEFVLLLCGLNSREDCEHTITRMLEELLLPFSLTEGKVGNISGSIGYTLFPEDAADADTLMRHADHAMYVAKQSGKNRFHRFDLSQSNRTKANWIALARIEKALKQEEFCLYIQPKVNLTTGKVVGAEALIRWLHPVRGLVPPMEFLPLIEDQDIAVDLGEWVIREGLRQMQCWSGQGLQLPLSVNVGARQLREKNFTQRLSALLKNFPDVPPWHLEIEIVESAALDDMHQVSMLIDGCQTLGVNFALDDFGTGYSSLTYLKRLSVNTLKIDQSFVRDMLNDGNDLAIVRGVIGLAQAFGSHTVAEGVETWQHASSLLELGCEIAQGYAIAHPMPAAEVADWVRNFRMPVI